MTSSIIGIDTTTKQRVEIPKPSRLRGLYIIGAPGTGKSGLIENLIIQDIEQDIGVCLLDPHGDLTQAILAKLPDRRVKDVILLDLLNTDYPFGLNLYQCSDPKDSTKVAYTRAQVMHIFTKLWGDENGKLGVWVEQYLRNSTTTLIEKGYTMAELSLLFRNKNARSLLTAHLINPQAIEFWEEHNELKPDDQQQRYNTNLNRADAFLSEPIIYNIVGQQHTTINFRTIMDERKILLVKLDARLEEMTNLIGALIIAQFLNAAYSRTDLPLEKRKQFNLYADEFQRFATEDFAILFTEARKFGMALTVAHQMRDQLDRQNRSATVNVANLIVFKVSSPDADELAGEFDCTPPPAELRREDKLTPVSNPFDWLVSGHSHKSPAVSQFADGTLRKIHLALYSEYKKEYDKPFISEFNSFLYRAMTSTDALSMLCEKSSLGFLLRLNDKYPFGTYYFGQTVVSLPEVKIINYVASNSYRLTYYIERHMDTRWANYSENHFTMPILFMKRDGDGTFDERMATALIAMLQSLGENQFIQASANFASLAEEKLRKRKTAYLAAYKPGYERISPSSWGFMEHGGISPVRRFLSPEEEEALCEQEFQRWMTEERLAFEAFIREFRDFVLALAKEPIADRSGIYEMMPGTQRTYQDMQNEIASRLVKLDQHTARVKIASDGTSVEHIIQTLNPKKESRFADAALQTRIADIQARNLQDGYVRERTEVEEEIRVRHARLRQPPEPTILPLSPDEPHEPPGSPRRKKIT